jgi:integrase
MVRRRSALGLPPHCERFTSKGITYVYARLPGGPRIRLLSPIGSEAFSHEYRTALDRLQGPVGTGQAAKGSVRAIATAYLASSAFRALKPDVQRRRQAEIERFCEKNAHRMLGKMAADDVKAMMAKIVSPHTQRLWRQALSSMCSWAADQAPPLLARNPFAEVGPVALPKAVPYRRWMPEHVAAFRARWPSGTIERRALEALINTMARGCSDVSRLSRTHIRDGALYFVAAKNGEAMDGIPISPELQAEIDLVPATDLLLFRNKLGAPLAPKRFGDMFRYACDEARLPSDLSAHGLRHAGACEAAERGESVLTIMALLGDRSPQAAMVYVKQVETARLMREAHVRRQAKAGT